MSILYLVGTPIGNLKGEAPGGQPGGCQGGKGRRRSRHHPHRHPGIVAEGHQVLPALCRELTKLHEEHLRTTLGQAIELYREREPKGEFWRSFLPPGCAAGSAPPAPGGCAGSSSPWAF